MMLAVLYLFASVLLASASNNTSSHQCQELPAAVSFFVQWLLNGERYLYIQHRFGPPLISDKCWSTSTFLSQVNLLDNSINPIWTFYDRKGSDRNIRAKMYIIGNSSKFYSVYNNTAYIETKFIVTPEYEVDYVCHEGQHAVLIKTVQKERDERVIQEAIAAAKKIIDLPSPSVNMECDRLVD